MADAGRVTGGVPTRNGKTARTEQLSACFNKSQREREREREKDRERERGHGCQMAIAGFIHCMCLALRASGLWLRYATLQNLIPSFPWIVPPRPPPWHNPRKGRDQILPSGNLELVWPLMSYDVAMVAFA